MSPLFDNLDRRIHFARDEVNNRAAGNDKRSMSGGQNERKGVYRPNLIVIVVIGVRDLRSLPVRHGAMNAIEVRVNDGGMIVIHSAGMYVLKRRDNECHQQGEA